MLKFFNMNLLPTRFITIVNVRNFEFKTEKNVFNR